MTTPLEFRDAVLSAYPDVYTPEAIRALEALDCTSNPSGASAGNLRVVSARVVESSLSG